MSEKKIRVTGTITLRIDQTITMTVPSLYDELREHGRNESWDIVDQTMFSHIELYRSDIEDSELEYSFGSTVKELPNQT